jgi:hypothetical protein
MILSSHCYDFGHEKNITVRQTDQQPYQPELELLPLSGHIVKLFS